MDVLLKREVDVDAREAHVRALDDLLRLALCWGHPLAEPRFDLGVLEVEEVARVVPDEAVLLDRLAVPADLGVGFEHENVLRRRSRSRTRDR